MNITKKQISATVLAALIATAAVSATSQADQPIQTTQPQTTSQTQPKNSQQTQNQPSGEVLSLESDPALTQPKKTEHEALESPEIASSTVSTANPTPEQTPNQEPVEPNTNPVKVSAHEDRKVVAEYEQNGQTRYDVELWCVYVWSDANKTTELKASYSTNKLKGVSVEHCSIYD